MDRILKTYKVQPRSDCNDEGSFSPIDLKNVGSAFLLVAGGMVLSVVCFVVEGIYSIIKGNNKHFLLHHALPKLTFRTGHC